MVIIAMGDQQCVSRIFFSHPVKVSNRGMRHGRSENNYSATEHQAQCEAV